VSSPEAGDLQLGVERGDIARQAGPIIYESASHTFRVGMAPVSASVIRVDNARRTLSILQSVSAEPMICFLMG
jgi:hypothetical protein